MQQNNGNFFDFIENKANVKQQDIFQIADSVKNADFNDDQTIRQLVRQLSALTGMPVTKEKEDEIVKAVTQKNMPLNFGSLSQMVNQDNNDNKMG
ncbi:stage VI sporulation protein F [Bacillus marinisedimentorum]|uniref:stage VI sporulation protein F n=1 Tax=Bacillus marinisedimentorum TaxID=1821260 RepID=UPI00087206DB|nr:stage VI sporulation protein F [Bacillus marinisedimentorum]